MTQLQENHYYVCENFIRAQDCQDILNVCLDKINLQQFSEAQIGNGFQQQSFKSIRNSNICWIDNWHETDALKKYTNRLHEIQLELNNYFFLSLKRFEGQFAHYPLGGHYKKHIDQLQLTNHRQVSSILYLNNLEKGGELVIYDKDDKNKIICQITPKAGTFVIFFSKTIYHEVLPCSEDRYSLTTWFRDDLEDY